MSSATARRISACPCVTGPAWHMARTRSDLALAAEGGRQPGAVTVHELSRVDARRSRLRAQRLDGERPAPPGDAVHQDVPFDTAMAAAVDHEIKDLAHWLGLELMPR